LAYGNSFGEPKPDEQKLIDRAIKPLRKRLGNPDEEPSWIRWGAFVVGSPANAKRAIS
jgi:hypothetical protein